MSDDKLDLKLNVDVDVHDAEKAKALREELARIDAELTAIGKHTNNSMKAIGAMAKAATGMRSKGSAGDAGARAAVEGERDLYAELRKRFAFERRMASQRRTEESESARAAREESRAVEERFRAQLAWNTRIAAQRAREEKAAETAIQREIRETGRMRDREARAAVKQANEQRRAQEQAVARATHGAGQVRTGAGRAVAIGGTAGLAAAYASERAIDALTRSGVTLDKAINANIRLSGLDPKAAAAKGKDLARKSAPIARSLGLKTSEYLQGRAEALQAGVDESIVDAVTEFGSKYAKLNDMSASEVLESSGYGITALSSFGKVGIDQVKQLFNKQQYLAATTAASRQGLAAFVRRGLSSGASAGFNLDDTLAYAGAATSSGADGEMAARMLSSTTERIASMPTRMADIQRKKHKTIKDRTLLNLPKKLGFGSWKELKNSFSQDAAGVMERIYEGLAQITDPRERLEASEEIFGREFGSVHSAMAVGHRFRDMRKAVRSNEANNAIDSGMSIKSGSFDFIMDQIGATIQSLKDGLGMVLKPFWADLRDWALKAPEAFDSFNTAFTAGLTGLLQGLGSPDGSMSGLLKSWLGDPGSFRANARAVGDFARGVGQGVKATAETVKTFFSAFAGANASAETIGRLSARFVSLSVACLALAPVMGVLGGLAGIIAGIVNIARAAATLGGVGAGAGAAIGAGALASVAKFLSRGFIIALAAEIGAHRGEIVTAMFDAVRPLWEAIITGLRKALSLKGLKSGAGAIIDEMIPAPLKRWLDGDSKPETPKSEAREWVDPPIRKPVEKLTESIDKMKEAVEDQAKVQKQSYQSEEFRSLIQKASISTIGSTINAGIRDGAVRAASPLSGTVGGGGALANSTPGGALPGTGLGRRGIIGGGGSGGASIPDSVPMTPTERNQLGLIMKYETGGRNIMNGVGARNGVSPTQAKGYTAQGYFQMLNSNWRRIAPKLGITAPNAMAASLEDQTRVALHLLRNGGIGNWANYNPKLRAALARGEQAPVGSVPQVGGSANDNSAPNVGGSAGYSKPRLAGQIDLEGVKYDYGSGGHRGANSIPVGTYPITPGTIGPWGRSHGALGINNNAIFDKELNRMRTGIEFHAASSASKLTAGCLGIARNQYGAFRAHVLKVIREQGSAFLTIGEDGRATITGGSPAVAGAKRMEQGITDTADKAKASPIQKPAGDSDVSNGAARDIGGGITQTMPFRKLGTDAPIRSPSAPSAGGGNSGGQPTMTITNNFHGNGQNHEELANAVQRKLGDDMRRRSHDLDYGYG